MYIFALIEMLLV